VSRIADSPARDLALEAGEVAAIGYTSGSTGRPTPNAKTWASFAWPAMHNARGLRDIACDGRADAVPWIVATVPSQHMYGMECTAMLPLLEGMAIHDSHPLFPADIAAALAAVAAPRVLVSTPVHLRALLESGVDLPPLAAVVSATAPLPAELAARVEGRFDARVLEFFGSTETCVIASRQTAREDTWLPYAGIRIAPGPNGALIEAPWLAAPMPMQDVFEFEPGGRFRIVGRSADMVEVAGKRTSIADLTRRLLGVAGVRDAVVLQPAAASGSQVRRLVAFVVGDGVTTHGIAAALADQVDPAFVPRPIVLVERLPRNDVGKLPRDRLLELVRNHGLDRQDAG
jgi:acyl-coenzyme A synthetase/AMP-(fatty) acid ligase